MMMSRCALQVPLHDLEERMQLQFALALHEPGEACIMRHDQWHQAAAVHAGPLQLQLPMTL